MFALQISGPVDVISEEEEEVEEEPVEEEPEEPDVVEDAALMDNLLVAPSTSVATPNETKETKETILLEVKTFFFNILFEQLPFIHSYWLHKVKTVQDRPNEQTLSLI